MAALTSTNLANLRKSSALPLSCVNHLSRNCTNLKTSLSFYEGVLGFVQIKRPGTLNFQGHWLFSYGIGIGIHLLQSPKLDGGTPQDKGIDPRDDHISFQCEDVDAIDARLRESGIRFKRLKVEQEGVLVDQIFFHDPDGFMIEVCNCGELPVVPLSL